MGKNPTKVLFRVLIAIVVDYSPEKYSTEVRCQGNVGSRYTTRHNSLKGAEYLFRHSLESVSHTFQTISN